MSKVIYIDVDDTLIRSFGSKRIPIKHMVEFVKSLKEKGMTLYCWSSGGAEYAKSSAEQLGISNCFDAFLSKPNILIDDINLFNWDLHQIHPNECRGKTVGELIEDLSIFRIIF